MYQNQTSPLDRSKQLGKNWIDGLKKRHPQLVTRKVRRVDSQRLAAETDKSIPKFFEWLKRCIKLRQPKPQNTYNMDETSVKIVIEGIEWVLTFISKEQKKTIEVEDYLNKDLLTFIKYSSATGVFLPFLAIFKG